MSRTTAHRRGRTLASLTAATGLLLGTAAFTSGAARSAEPAGDCATSFPVAEIAAGDAVDGLTVTSGTTPEPFTGEVLGVLQDGIAPDVDMIMMRLTSPEIDRVGGIWQGMSGSPVYADDGRLIGAVAYGLSYGPSPVAGVTPFADMDDYLAASGRQGKIEVDRDAARIIARHSEVSPDQARQGFAQLPMPLGVSGLSAQRLAEATGRAYLPKNTYRIGTSAAPDAAGPETIVAGGNIAASLSYGDVNQAGVGTATSVCNGRVVGFGHPMAFLGSTTMSMHPADAIYIQEDKLGAAFKVANLSAPAGTITDDHLTGITGVFGSLPDATTITSAVAFGDRSRTGTSFVTVPDATAGTTFYQIIANHDRVLDSVTGGSEELAWRIEGTDTDGSPFALEYAEHYTSAYDITYEAVFDLADFVYALSLIPGVTIEAVTADSQVNTDRSTYKVGSLQQYRDGAWLTVGKGEPALVKAGTRLIMRAVLRGPDGTRTVPVSVSVPERARGSRGDFVVTGGNSIYSEGFSVTSVHQAERLVATMVRNDELQVDLFIFGDGVEVSKSTTAGPADKVVNGHRRVRVRVQ